MIDYRVRFSARARCIRLTITPHSGLEVIIPKGFDPANVPSILLRKQEWIQKAFRKIENQKPLTFGQHPKEIPTEIHLKSIDEVWKVMRVSTLGKKNYLYDANDRMIKLHLTTDDPKIGFTLLQKWIEKKGAQILIPWLNQYSIDHGFEYKKGILRLQKTRWGSCSSRKSISLNRTLLFLPRHLVEYVMLHELCHTVEMNHSSRYWALVEKHCLHYKEFDKELKQARYLIPEWMFFWK